MFRIWHVPARKSRRAVSCKITKMYKFIDILSNCIRAHEISSSSILCKRNLVDVFLLQCVHEISLSCTCASEIAPSGVVDNMLKSKTGATCGLNLSSAYVNL